MLFVLSKLYVQVRILSTAFYQEPPCRAQDHPRKVLSISFYFKSFILLAQKVQQKDMNKVFTLHVNVFNDLTFSSNKAQKNSHRSDGSVRTIPGVCICFKQILTLRFRHRFTLLLFDPHCSFFDEVNESNVLVKHPFTKR